jgi:hypothetical protein
VIFFFCGAPKHGSHYQLLIITESLAQLGIDYVPIGVKVFDHNESRAARELLDSLHRERDRLSVCKGHFLDRDLLLSYDDIKIFHIWRDLGDVLVSRYHYLQRR